MRERAYRVAETKNPATVLMSRVMKVIPDLSAPELPGWLGSRRPPAKGGTS
jgi:hypothetical protein